MHIEVKPYSIITCLNEFIQLYSCAYCIGPKSKNFKLFIIACMRKKSSTDKHAFVVFMLA